jgi:hypothetical protein
MNHMIDALNSFSVVLFVLYCVVALAGGAWSTWQLFSKECK